MALVGRFTLSTARRSPAESERGDLPSFHFLCISHARECQRQTVPAISGIGVLRRNPKVKCYGFRPLIRADIPLLTIRAWIQNT